MRQLALQSFLIRKGWWFMNRGVIFCLFLFFGTMVGISLYLNYIKARHDPITLVIICSLVTVLALPKILDSGQMAVMEKIEE